MADHSVSIGMSSPDVTEREIAAVVSVLRSGRLSLGPAAAEFERAFAAYVGAQAAVSVSSGTAALHLALIAAGVSDGDLVVTTPFSFVATASAILYERAVPVFVDVEPATGNLDVAALERVVTGLASGGRTGLPRRLGTADEVRGLKAILPVHVFGRPVDMTSVTSLARAHDLAVIEDACEAVGAEWDGRRVGALGDVGCFGFYPNKQLTTAEGGMIVTNDPCRAALCRSLRNHARDDQHRFVSNRVGHNYRLSEMSCALGLVQLDRLEELLEKRARVARWYDERLADVPGVRSPAPAAPGSRPTWFVYVVRFDDPSQRASTTEALHAAGIASRHYFDPIHLHPYFTSRFGYQPGDFPNAERLADACLALPFASTMTEPTVDRVCEALRASIAG